jgi:hypothetical protein
MLDCVWTGLTTGESIPKLESGTDGLTIPPNLRLFGRTGGFSGVFLEGIRTHAHIPSYIRGLLGCKIGFAH